MRLVSYSANDGLRAGIDVGDEIADVHATARAAGWEQGRSTPLAGARAVVALDSELLGELSRTASTRADVLREEGGLRPKAGLRLGPPIPDPQKIICLGLNYRDHAAEAGLQAPIAPMFFAKYANSLIGPADEIVPPAVAADQVDYEGELAVVIGRRARNVVASEALQHIAGAMVFNDVSARDLQRQNNLWTGGKAIDTFAPCGPALVTLDEIEDLQALRVRTRVNGETVQDGSTSSMIFGVAETVEFLTGFMTLEPGDIIATGTPAGVGMSRTPQLFMRAGDVVEVEIEGLGTVRNRVARPA